MAPLLGEDSLLQKQTITTSPCLSTLREGQLVLAIGTTSHYCHFLQELEETILITESTYKWNYSLYNCQRLLLISTS